MTDTTTTATGDDISPMYRRRAVEFLITAAADLQLRPIVKYSALSLFADRFYTSISSSTHRRRNHSHWLLSPSIRQSNVELFSLVSIWISSKLHDSRPLPLQSLKSYSDRRIRDQIFTRRDFLDAEMLLLQELDFEIGTSRIAFVFLEDLVVRFRETAKAGEWLSLEVAMDVLDLVYEEERAVVLLIGSPVALAAAILVVSYVVSVPRQEVSEFPVLPWVRFVTSRPEEEILRIVEGILGHIVMPFGVTH